MSTQFERSHCVVGSRTITLTSWFDEARQIWQTSAPSYMHLTSVTEASHIFSTSRNAGLACLTDALVKHFAPYDQAYSAEMIRPTEPVRPRTPARAKAPARPKEQKN